MTPQPGDPCFRGNNPRAVWFVVGILADGGVEAVAWKHIRERTIRVDGWEDILDGVRGGRLNPYRFREGQLTPYPTAAFESLFGDEEEPEVCL